MFVKRDESSVWKNVKQLCLNPEQKKKHQTTSQRKWQKRKNYIRVQICCKVKWVYLFNVSDSKMLFDIIHKPTSKLTVRIAMIISSWYAFISPLLITKTLLSYGATNGHDVTFSISFGSFDLLERACAWRAQHFDVSNCKEEKAEAYRTTQYASLSLLYI